MADRIRYHLDEHVDPAIATALRRAGVDVTTTIEAGLRTKDDQAHLAFARTEERVIVTRDQDFLRFAAQKNDHCGIVFYTANQSMREIIEGLILIYEVMLPSEITGNIEYLIIRLTLGSVTFRFVLPFFNLDSDSLVTLISDF